ncbi:MAG: biotin-dependent carboxyltransferase [Chloroflexi bacterium]|nr:biotin-dependent carboxyltransferase [Chloroflexota bacterium]MBI1855051.1 biotin-dependent carboxyltransferase [Chloroflexota bacterium]MBI3338603.1 biotin-dependent carboxyltransferase [Chloroflexota bacterium]
MFEVLDVSGFATIQDLGRAGWRRFGVPASGPMDSFAFRAANLLAGNSMDAAALEIGAGEIELRALNDCVIAAAGAGYSLSVFTWTFPLWDSCFVRAGWTIRLNKSGFPQRTADFGMWAYLAFAGGLEIESVLGSRSTYLRGHFGGLDGRLLQAGDVLRSGRPARALDELAARTLIEEARPAYNENPMVDVILGPQTERFDEKNIQTFLSSSYKVNHLSDRMGYRLEGPRSNHIGGADLTSEGMMAGAVQVPADGQPIVMMADCATAGGYPKIASVISADLPLLAQCAPGKDSVRFRATTVEAAQEKFRALMEKMKNGIVDS